MLLVNKPLNCYCRRSTISGHADRDFEFCFWYTICLQVECKREKSQWDMVACM